MKVKQAMITGMIGVAAFAGSMFGGALVKADTQDAVFLDFIASQGAGVGLVIDNPAIAVREGKAACTVLDRGYTIDETVSAVDSVLPVNRDGAIVIVAAAIYAYCPAHDPRLEDVLV